MNSREFLEALKKKSRTEAYDVLYYFRLFASISRELVSREKLDPCTQCQWFLRGLPESVLMSILYRYDIDLEGDNDPDFEVILEKLLVLARCRNRLATGFITAFLEAFLSFLAWLRAPLAWLPGGFDIEIRLPRRRFFICLIMVDGRSNCLIRPSVAVSQPLLESMLASRLTQSSCPQFMAILAERDRCRIQIRLARVVWFIFDFGKCSQVIDKTGPVTFGLSVCNSNIIILGLSS